METNDEPTQPDQSEARESLRQARRAEEAIRYPKTPYWLFALNAALLSALTLSQLLGSRATEATIAVAMAVIAINLLAARKAGVIGAASANRGWGLALLAVFVVIVGSWLVYDIVDHPWPVIVGAVVVAGLVLLGGRSYQKRAAAS